MFWQLLISSLVIGSVYGLIALGYSLIYKASGLLTFAQGDLPLHPVADRLQFFQRFHTVFRSFLLTSLGLSSKVR